MLDIKFIRENLDLVKKSTKEKGYKIDVDEAIRLDDERKSVLVKVEALRQRRNEIAAKMKGGKPDAALIEEGKNLKSELAASEAELSEATWVRREDIPEYETDVSISCCLIEDFRRGN